VVEGLLHAHDPAAECRRPFVLTPLGLRRPVHGCLPLLLEPGNTESYPPEKRIDLVGVVGAVLGEDAAAGTRVVHRLRSLRSADGFKMNARRTAGHGRGKIVGSRD